MRKRRVFGMCGIASALVVAGIATLIVLLKHEPNFYAQSQTPSSPARKELAHTVLSNFLQMRENIKGKQEKWWFDANTPQMNAFFEEIFEQLGETEGLRKLGISSPSVVLEDGHFRLAFRYGSGWFSTVVSYDLKIWLVPKEPNVIAIEILSARAGALPISSQSILQQVTEFARGQNYKVNLYRHDSHPVAVVQLQEDPQPTAILTTLQVESNKLSVRGRTLEHALALPIVEKN